LPPEVGSTSAGLPKKFGRYEVVRELGKGAMGVVYLGRDPVIGRLVALKTIRGVGDDDHEQKEFSERFLREAQAAGTLSHPNIVTVHDVGEDEQTETSFIAMEYVEGKNVKQLLRDKAAFSFDRAAEIIAQVGEALDYAHRHGIVHRDVKPANIIITPDGAVKITDFGIAKIETSNLTEAGQFLGTPNYMSPEQVTGEPVDGRSDLFSLGVVLYELLTRKKPFIGDNLTSISYKIVHESFTPAETYGASIPPELSALLTKALSKDPAQRFQRGTEFAQALSQFRARQAEREMLHDLGAMVAEAENLGRVSAVENPPSSSSAQQPVVKAAPQLIGSAPPPAPAARKLEDMARPRADLDPAQARTPSQFADDIPDWDLDTGEREIHESVPSSPGTLISDLRLPRAAGATSPEAAPVFLPQPAPPPAPVPASPAPVRQPLFGPTDGKPAETGPISRPPPRPPAAPSAATGASVSKPPLRSSPPPAPPPLPNLAAPRPFTPREISAAPRLPAPMPPKEPTGPVRLGPTTATAPPTAPSVPVDRAARHEVLKRDVNRRYVWAIVGAAALAGAAVVGLMLARRSSIAQEPVVDERTMNETSEKRRLLEEGNRLLAAGKAEEARQKLLELVHRAPDSRAARQMLQKAETLVAEQSAQRTTPEGAPAGTASASAAGNAAASVAPAPPASVPNLRISFTSPFPQGVVFVKCNDKEVFRRSFDFGRRSSGGPVHGDVEVPAGPGEFKVWVIASDNSVRQYQAFNVTVPEGAAKTFAIEVDPSKGLTAELR
jgi:serine/threonine protein kinase